MYKILISIVILLMVFSCRTVPRKNVNQDMQAVNEQLYQLEKADTQLHKQVLNLEKKIVSAEKKMRQNGSLDIRALYLQALTLFRNNKYTETYAVLDKILKRSTVVNRYFQSALFMGGDCKFNSDDFKSASELYSLYYSLYPFTERSDEALYKSGLALFQTKKYYLSNSALLKLIREYPKSKYLAKARYNIRKLKKYIRRKKL